MLPYNDKQAREHVDEILAKVLSNRKPPYPITGGLYDAMKDAGGEVLLANNDELTAAADLFKKLEGNDIHPAAAVATATLIDSAKNGVVKTDDLIMLNITGGGEDKFKAENELFYLKPELIFDIDPDENEVKEKVKLLFKK
jgi:cysteate synthase